MGYAILNKLVGPIWSSFTEIGKRNTFKLRNTDVLTYNVTSLNHKLLFNYCQLLVQRLIFAFLKVLVPSRYKQDRSKPNVGITTRGQNSRFFIH